jgi:hypothetical protein
MWAPATSLQYLGRRAQWLALRRDLCRSIRGWRLGRLFRRSVISTRRAKTTQTAAFCDEEEARQLIQDAIRLHLESRIARDEPIYQEVGSHKVRVAV